MFFFSFQEGYKCYLFACNGSCTLASHEDYTILTSKKAAAYYTTIAVKEKPTDVSTSTICKFKFYIYRI